MDVDLERRLSSLRKKIQMIKDNKNTIQESDACVVRFFDYRLKKKQQLLVAEANKVHDMLVPDIIA